MSTTLLFSAVAEAADRFEPYVAELRGLLEQHGLPTGQPAALPALVEAIRSDSSFRDDLTSMLRVIYAEAPEITYLELLAVVLVAALGAGAGASDGHVAQEEGDARSLLNFLVEVRRVMKAEMRGLLEPLSPDEAVDAVDENAAVPLASPPPLPKAASSGTSQATLARALALAGNGNFSGVGSPDVETPAPHTPALTEPVPRAVAELAEVRQRRPPGEFAAPPEPVRAVEERSAGPQKDDSGGERNRWTWLAGVCGVLLGLLLGVALARFWSAGHTGAPAGLAGGGGSAVTEAPAAPSPGKAATPGATPGKHPPAGAGSAAKSRPPGESDRPEARDAPRELARRHTEAGNRGTGTGLANAAEAAAAAPAKSGVPAFASPRPPPMREVNLNPPVDPGGYGDGRFGAGLPRVTAGSSGIMAANLLSSPTPAYPAPASAAQVQGEVVIEAVVGREGDVVEARVVSGPPLLRDAALRAVQQWRYRPFEVDGKPAEVATTARVAFRLH